MDGGLFGLLLLNGYVEAILLLDDQLALVFLLEDDRGRVVVTRLEVCRARVERGSERAEIVIDLAVDVQHESLVVGGKNSADGGLGLLQLAVQLLAVDGTDGSIKSQKLT
jgi:hypothetical protein